MTEGFELLVHTYPSEDQLKPTEVLFSAVSLGSLIEIRNATSALPPVPGRTGVVSPLSRESIANTVIIAAAAAQELTLGAFTQPITVALTRISPSTVMQGFSRLEARGLFVNDLENSAAPNKSTRGREGGRRTRIYHPTPLCREYFDLLDLSS